jgi:hypothetical protein
MMARRQSAVATALSLKVDSRVLTFLISRNDLLLATIFARSSDDKVAILMMLLESFVGCFGKTFGIRTVDDWKQSGYEAEADCSRTLGLAGYHLTIMFKHKH